MLSHNNGRPLDFSEVAALSASLGWGVINWLFALPAFYTIDTFGCRNLLLTTFPLMSLFLFFTGFSFWIPQESTAHIACITLGIYLFGIVYSPGEGPVPFTYSAEAYLLYIRPIGMSLATATTWFFNFILFGDVALLAQGLRSPGAFSWYAAWNIVGFFAVLFFVPETKEKTLEELDSVFNVSLRTHMRYGLDQFLYFFRRLYSARISRRLQFHTQRMLNIKRRALRRSVRPIQPTEFRLEQCSRISYLPGYSPLFY